MKKAPGDVEFSVSFGETRDSLIIDSEENIVDATNYVLNISGAFGNDKFVNKFDNDLTYSASDYSSGEVETLNFSTNDNNEAPHTPTIALEQVDSDTVDDNEGSVNVSWTGA